MSFCSASINPSTSVAVNPIEPKTDTNGQRMQKHFDFLLLGGGPASVSAAETLRAEGAKGSILLVSNEVYAPYGHTYLSKQFLFGALPKEKLLIHNEAYYQEQAIDVILDVSAIAVDTANRLVRVARQSG
jgi:NTE family protein